MRVGKIHYMVPTAEASLSPPLTLCGRPTATAGWVSMNIPKRRSNPKPKDTCTHCYAKMKK